MTTTAKISDQSETLALQSGTSVVKSSNTISPEAAAVVVAVTVPIVVIAIVLLCFFQIQKHWKMHRAQEIAAATVDAIIKSPSQPKDVQLYLQNKAELSVEQTGLEMQPKEEIYELMDRNQFQEMPGEEIRQPMLSLGERHELRGEDHAKELDTSPNQQDSNRYRFDEPDFQDLNNSFLMLHEFV